MPFYIKLGIITKKPNSCNLPAEEWNLFIFNAGDYI